MGAFKDLLDILRASVSGLVPLGGTLNPVSEGVPIAFAQNIKGNFAVYPTIDALADIPYDLLSLDMEAVVQEHTRPDTTIHIRTKYRLKILPAEGHKINENPLYDISNYWEALPEPGEGDQGLPGFNGWSALYVLENNGTESVVEKFHSWTGGSGPQPFTPVPPNDYRGSSGFVSKSLAINVKGPPGPPGSDVLVRPTAYFKEGIRRWNSPAIILNYPGKPPGFPNTPEIPYPDPATLWPHGTAVFAWASEPLSVSNPSLSANGLPNTQPRTFMLFGEVPVANSDGPAVFAVRLFKIINTGDGVSSANNILLDENQGDPNYVSAFGYFSVHKINVRSVFTLIPGETGYFRLAMAKFAGNAAYYDSGFLEAFGI